MKKQAWLLLGASMAALAAGAPAYAQDAETDTAVDEVIVTAQRREQRIQDVPMTINAVTGATLEELNIFTMTDVQTLAPGLTLDASDGRQAKASLRGATYEPDAGASSGTVAFYFNELGIDPAYAFRSLYDIGQIEVLRGPQGTLRGQTAPAGAVTIKTHSPDYFDYGGSISQSLSDANLINTQGVVNIPIIEGKLAVRLAGVYDSTDGNQIRSFNSGEESSDLTRSYRATVGWKPTDNFSAELVHQNIKSVTHVVPQVVGNGNPALAFGLGNGPVISASDRLGVTEGPNVFDYDIDLTTLAANYDIGEHRLSYTGGYLDVAQSSDRDIDTRNALTSLFGAPGFAQRQRVDSKWKSQFHELRFANTGEHFWNYLVGANYSSIDTPTVLAQDQVYSADASSGDVTFHYPVAQLPTTDVEAVSIFTHHTLNFTDRLSVQLGVRYQELRQTLTNPTGLAYGEFGIIPADDVACTNAGGTNGVGGFPSTGMCFFESLTPAQQNQKDSGTSGLASVSYKFTPDIMGYATYGHSWRGGGPNVGAADIASEVDSSLLVFGAEKSDSFEVGVKSDLFNRRLRVNAAAFYQKYDGYISRIPGVDLSYNSALVAGEISQSASYQQIVNAPAVTKGLELELSGRVTDQWSFGVRGSIQDAKFDNAQVPCNDVDGDGVPDATSSPLGAVSQGIINSGLNYAVCTANYRLGFVPDWQMSADSEYTIPVGDNEAYVRGLFTYSPKISAEGGSNVAESYGLLNLYAGLRAGSGGWEVSVWAKNVFDEEAITSMTPVDSFNSRQYYNVDSGYNTVSTTLPRELGVTVRLAFGGI